MAHYHWPLMHDRVNPLAFLNLRAPSIGQLFRWASRTEKSVYKKLGGGDRQGELDLALLAPKRGNDNQKGKMKKVANSSGRTPFAPASWRPPLFPAIARQLPPASAETPHVSTLCTKPSGRCAPLRAGGEWQGNMGA